MNEEKSEILSKGMIIGLKLSLVYLIIFIIVILFTPESVSIFFAKVSVVFFTFLIFGVIAYGVARKILKK